MTDLMDEDEPSKAILDKRWRTMALATMKFAPPVISIGCAIMVGYLTYVVTSQKPPPDMAALAVSILKSGDASPEMRDWAAEVLGIQTDIRMPARFIQQ